MGTGDKTATWFQQITAHGKFWAPNLWFLKSRNCRFLWDIFLFEECAQETTSIPTLMCTYAVCKHTWEPMNSKDAVMCSYMGTWAPPIFPQTYLPYYQTYVCKWTYTQSHTASGCLGLCSGQPSYSSPRTTTMKETASGAVARPRVGIWVIISIVASAATENIATTDPSW